MVDNRIKLLIKKLQKGFRRLFPNSTAVAGSRKILEDEALTTFLSHPGIKRYIKQLENKMKKFGPIVGVEGFVLDPKFSLGNEIAAQFNSGKSVKDIIKSLAETIQVDNKIDMSIRIAKVLNYRCASEETGLHQAKLEWEEAFHYILEPFKFMTDDDFSSDKKIENVQDKAILVATRFLAFDEDFKRAFKIDSESPVGKDTLKNYASENEFTGARFLHSVINDYRRNLFKNHRKQILSNRQKVLYIVEKIKRAKNGGQKPAFFFRITDYSNDISLVHQLKADIAKRLKDMKRISKFAVKRKDLNENELASETYKLVLDKVNQTFEWLENNAVRPVNEAIDEINNIVTE